MIKYIYINEDNFPKQSSTEPTEGDIVLLNEGFLSIYRVRCIAGKVEIEELDKGEWSAMEEAKIIGEGRDDAYHG